MSKSRISSVISLYCFPPLSHIDFMWYILSGYFSLYCRITVTLNVNHTVDTDEAEMSSEQANEASLKSKPSFEVDIQVGSKTMSFTCSFTSVDVSGEQDAPEG